MSAQVLTHRSRARLAGGQGGAADPAQLRAGAPGARRAVRFHQGAPRRAARDRSRSRRHGRALPAGGRRLRAHRPRAQGPPDVGRRPERRLGPRAHPRRDGRSDRQCRAFRVARLARDDRGRRPRRRRRHDHRARRWHADRHRDAADRSSIRSRGWSRRTRPTPGSAWGCSSFERSSMRTAARSGRSVAEKGTTFTVVLPRRPSRDA